MKSDSKDLCVETIYQYSHLKKCFKYWETKNIIKMKRNDQQSCAWCAVHIGPTLWIMRYSHTVQPRVCMIYI